MVALALGAFLDPEIEPCDVSLLRVLVEQPQGNVVGITEFNCPLDALSSRHRFTPILGPFLLPHVDEDRQDNDDALDDLLPVRTDREQVHSVVDDADDQCADSGYPGFHCSYQQYPFLNRRSLSDPGIDAGYANAVPFPDVQVRGF